MKLQFLGTGAAEGVPGAYCDCPTCREIRRRGKEEFHTRSQLLVDDKVGIDYPPDAYAHALAFGENFRKIEHLLITHSHMDHFYAHDFILRGYKYAGGQPPVLHIYGNEEVAKVYAECTRRELRADVAEGIKIHVVSPFQPFSFGEQGEYVATALPAQHSQTEQAFVYLLQKGETSYLHLTDTGRLPAKTLDFLQTVFENNVKKIDFVTFDCTFLFHAAGEVSRHMGLEDNKAMEQEFLRRGIADNNTRYAITHFSHNSNPLSETLERAFREYGYLPARDGLTVEV